MHLATTQAGLLAAELEARGFLAGIGKTILFVIIILVVLGALLGFSVARRFGRRR
jgi:membrane protein DedA with SNARE-associated domain